MSSIEQVEEFHETFGHPAGDQPVIPPMERILFRTDFITEEMEELIAAAKDGNIVEFFDAIGDIKYVLEGLILEAGGKDIMDAISTEIHRSNMSKSCVTIHDVSRSIERLKEQFPGEKFSWKYRNRRYVIQRDRDTKVQKGSHYFKPDLLPIIQKAFDKRE